MSAGVTEYEDLLTAEAVRSQCARVAEHVRAGRGVFEVHDDRLDACAQHVVDVTLEQYPTLDIPYHSRWRHFAASGVTLLEEELLAHLAALAALDGLEAARVGFDLVVPSVLLDAGAGAAWTFDAPGADRRIGRSEGLGLASLGMFLDGAFSRTGDRQTNAEALVALDRAALAAGFQVDDSNPLVGLDGRLDVVRGLGGAIVQRPDVFPTGRPGDLVDHLLGSSVDGSVDAGRLLETVLDVLSPMWPARLVRDGLSLGDAWTYAPFGDGPGGIVPFHKLSQWLTYSLVETLLRSDISVTGVERLTGLPEYRNGGLFYESGVLTLRDPSLAELTHAPDSQLIVEWRALTVTLLDAVAERVRVLLDRPGLQLAEILEGGTWAAGRQLAFARTPTGTPPLHLDSDGTVF